MGTRSGMLGRTLSASAGLMIARVCWRSWRRLHINAFKRQGVIISNPTDFERKKRLIIKGGLNNLQVIADFDRTITKSFVNGERGASCHGIMESLETLSTEYRQLTKELFERYYPLEISSVLTKEEKIPLMTEWYSKAHDLLLTEGVTRMDIAAAVKGANLELRDGWPELMRTLQDNQVPLLVFSAGIANVIAEVFEQKFGATTASTHIISNWLTFSENGTIVEFSMPLIHMFNKDSSQTVGTDYHRSVATRGNVILLGDGLGDVTMAEGIPHNEVLKVGFLNESSDTLLCKYKQEFDVVIMDDGSMDFVNDLVRLLV